MKRAFTFYIDDNAELETVLYSIIVRYKGHKFTSTFNGVCRVPEDKNAAYLTDTGVDDSPLDLRDDRHTTLSLPVAIGDTVFAYIGDAARKKKRRRDDLIECIVSEISVTKDRPEPLFTVLNYEIAEYERFWLHDFGSEVFTKEQYFAMAEKGGKRRPMQNTEGSAYSVT